MIKKIIYSFLFLAVGFFIFLFVVAQLLSGGKYKGPVSDHFNGTIFFNSYVQSDKKVDKSFQMKRSFRFMRIFKEKVKWPDWVESEYGPAPEPSVTGKRISYTVVNHATVLIQVGGLNILTDPIWSKRASPVSFIGPARVRNPGIQFKDLPRIDVVTISHNHYDHMDLPTLIKLDKKFSPKFLVGLGNKGFLESKGLKNVIEMDWWSKVNIGKSAIYFVPARHGANRSINDSSKTLWGGYFIKSSGKRIFFSGDTGYGMHFLVIYKRFGAMDLSFLPIGAYEPRWFMKHRHLNPMDAVKAHQDLRSKRSVGIHFGTFQLTTEGIDQPKLDLKSAITELSVSSSSFVIPEFGQSVLVR